jgi:hypothetical protein
MQNRKIRLAVYLSSFAVLLIAFQNCGRPYSIDVVSTNPPAAKLPQDTQMPAATPSENQGSNNGNLEKTGQPRMIIKHSGKCVDLPDSSDRLAWGVVQWFCYGLENQQFDIKKTKDGAFTIQTNPSKLCLDTGGKSDGTVQIKQQKCIDKSVQKFYIVDQPDGTSMIYTFDKKGCWDIQNSLLIDGAKLLSAPCTGHDNQKFTLEYPQQSN